MSVCLIRPISGVLVPIKGAACKWCSGTGSRRPISGVPVLIKWCYGTGLKDGSGVLVPVKGR